MSKSEINANFLFKNKYSKIVKFFLNNFENEFYVNEILKAIKISPKVLCDSLKDLESAGILIAENKANAIYYRLNKKNKIVGSLKKMIKPITYKDSGVNIDTANLAVKKIRKYAAETYNKNVLSNVGSFGGLYQFDKDNVLVSSTDGVGTKLKLAFMTDRHDTIGQDLVNHCVNDILVMGAKPLFFLDYIGTGKLNPEVIGQIVKGLSKACRENDVALIGGETAEMPGFYKDGEYDLASFIVGTVNKSKIIDGSKVGKGDSVIGLSSNGLHTNGYSLALKVLLEHAKIRLNQKPKDLGIKLKDELMKIHLSYCKPVSEILEKYEIKAMAHITGGGLLENIPRVIPQNCSVKLHKSRWKVQPIFNLIQRLGNVPEKDMYRTFNMGIGFVLIVNKTDSIGILGILKKYNFDSDIIGDIVEGKKQVKII
jgi:phosphoribosylformylglycinamidine cyclo-ligase